MSHIKHTPAAIRHHDQQQEESERNEQSRTPTVAHEDEWLDPDTASIATRDSQDLYARRPNRWRGKPRAWRHITEHDRAVATALWRARDCDLSAHLYNAFFLKKQVSASSSAWTPGNYWTAWPLRPHDGLSVFDDDSYNNDPADGGIDADNNEHDNINQNVSQWTFRSRHPPVEKRPSGPLEEMLTATIQRVARKQFHAMLQREAEGFDAQTAAVSADDELSAHLLRPTVRHLLTQTGRMLSILHNSRVDKDAAAEARAIPLKSKRHRSPSAERGGVEQGSVRQFGRQLPQPSKKQVCVRPSHWKTGPPLMMATARTPEQVAASIPEFCKVHQEADPSSTGTASQAQAQTLMPSRARKSSAVKAPSDTSRGRPHKQRERLPGETEKQFLIRIARQAHRRIPECADDEDSKGPWEDEGPIKGGEKGKGKMEKIPAVVTYIPPPIPPFLHRRVSFANEVQSLPNWIRNVSGPESETDNDGDDAEGEGEKMEKQEKQKPGKATKPTAIPAKSKTGSGGSTMAGRRLRNWTDILAAAALSGGFSPNVLTRTAQRCADLFGQSTALCTLHGVPEPVDQRQTLQEHQQQQQQQQKGQKKNQPCTAEHVVFRPEAGLPHLPDILSEPKPSSSLQMLTIEVQRAQAQRRARQLRKKAIWKQYAGQCLYGEMGMDDDDEQDEQDEEDVVQDGEDSGSESGDDRGKIEDEGTNSQPSGPSCPQPRPVSTIVPPDALFEFGGTTSSAPQQDIASVARSKRGPTPKATPTTWYCPRPNCPRAFQGFPRRPNMMRHLKLVHGITLERGSPTVPSQD
ncbi:hypothetical protein SEPCBS57363_000020 [Sporothrix epigloea]|uniref:Rrn9 domain-containing protein n=1 Tax=Sporothrix epigloea TaxID=1892477 RepID=A0ABP0D2H9_9PEZI